MSYFPKGHTGDEVDDFDEYDPTPYGGGYDIHLTYGRPLPPSEETCYPNTSDSLDFDYDRPQYTSYAEPCAYTDDVLENEYNSYARPKPRPAPSPYGGPPPSEPGYGYDGPGPDYGFQPGINRPGGGYGEEGEYGSGGGFGYGGRTEYGRPQPEYGSGYGRRPEYEMSGSEYGRRPEFEQPPPDFGSGYGYGRRPGSEYPSGHGQEYGSGGYGRKAGYGEEESGGGYGYNPRPERSEYGEYERPSYGRPEEGYNRKPSYERRDDDDEGYGRKEYGDSYGEEEHRYKHHHHHHHLKHYDD
jgi:hypothetical protein